MCVACESEAICWFREARTPNDVIVKTKVENVRKVKQALAGNISGIELGNVVSVLRTVYVVYATTSICMCVSIVCARIQALLIRTEGSTTCAHATVFPRTGFYFVKAPGSGEMMTNLECWPKEIFSFVWAKIANGNWQRDGGSDESDGDGIGRTICERLHPLNLLDNDWRCVPLLCVNTDAERLMSDSIVNFFQY